MASEVRQQAVVDMESVTTLASGIAHNFNNLMVGVLGYAELLRRDFAHEPRASTMLSKIIVSAQRACDITQQLLAFADGGPCRPQVMDLNATVRDVLQTLLVTPAPGIRVCYYPAPALPPIEADRQQMAQMVKHLYLNAIEAIGNEGCITLSTASVVFDEDCAARPPALSPGRYVLFAVADTGCGMSAETQSRVFSPFFTTKFLGRGLGLATVHGIVKNLKGHVALHSAEGRGTTVHIYLPAVS